MSAELLPCPFCGSAEIRYRQFGQFDSQEEQYCMGCGASAEPKVWNTRSPSAQPSEGAVDGQALASALGLGGIPKAQPTGKPIQRWHEKADGGMFKAEDGYFVTFSDAQAGIAQTHAAFIEACSQRADAEAEVQELKAKLAEAVARQKESVSGLLLHEAEKKLRDLGARCAGAEMEATELQAEVERLRGELDKLKGVGL